MTSTTDVLVIGAGPSGLTMATLLAQSGVRLRIVDKKAGPTEETRAIIMHAKTLELLDKLDLADEAVEKGRRMDKFRLLWGGKRAGWISFQDRSGRTPYPFPLIYTQDQTEHLLLGKLEEVGGQVEWNTELLHLEQTPTGTCARIRQDNGDEETIEAAWIVGADGAHSLVRHALSLSFEGERYEQALFLADVDLEGDLPEKEVVAGFTRLGFFTFFPMPGERRFRVLGSLPLEWTDRYTLTIDEVQQIIHTYKGIQVTAANPRWISVYRTYHRISEYFRVGRVFLIGDAAHIHSPAGGQGMNTGIGDAYNLAWKLALVVMGKARERLLDSYEQERIPFARAILNGSDKLFQLQAMSHPLVQRLKMFVLPPFVRFITSSDALSKRIFWLASQLWTQYRTSSAVHESGLGKKGARAGDRAPYGFFESGQDKGMSIFHLFKDPDHHLLLFAGERSVLASDDLQELQEHFRTLIDAYEVPLHLHTVSESNRTLHKRYGANKPGLFLVRPDGHIAYRGRADDLEGLRNYLDGLYERREKPQQTEAREGQPARKLFSDVPTHLL